MLVFGVWCFGVFCVCLFVGFFGGWGVVVVCMCVLCVGGGWGGGARSIVFIKSMLLFFACGCSCCNSIVYTISYASEYFSELPYVSFKTTFMMIE